MTEELLALQKKYFPRVPWTEQGPVRRVYRARAARDGAGGVVDILAALSRQEGFTDPERPAAMGGADETLAAFKARAAGGPVGMIFGTETAAHWCDVAADGPDGQGWQRLIVRSEEGENLIALAHDLGLLRFKRAE